MFYHFPVFKRQNVASLPDVSITVRTPGEATSAGKPLLVCGAMFRIQFLETLFLQDLAFCQAEQSRCGKGNGCFNSLEMFADSGLQLCVAGLLCRWRVLTPRKSYCHKHDCAATYFANKRGVLPPNADFFTSTHLCHRNPHLCCPIVSRPPAGSKCVFREREDRGGYFIRTDAKRAAVHAQLEAIVRSSVFLAASA